MSLSLCSCCWDFCLTRDVCGTSTVHDALPADVHAVSCVCVDGDPCCLTYRVRQHGICSRSFCGFATPCDPPACPQAGPILCLHALAEHSAAARYSAAFQGHDLGGRGMSCEVNLAATCRVLQAHVFCALLQAAVQHASWGSLCPLEKLACPAEADLQPLLEQGFAAVGLQHPATALRMTILH